MISKEASEYMRNDFIDALRYFSNGKISVEEANDIANKKLRLTDFCEGSPVAHKGPRWLAMMIVRNMGVYEIAH